MTDTFIHGIEVQELPGPPPPIATASASVIGLVGTCSKATDGPSDYEPIRIRGSIKAAEKVFGARPTSEAVPADNTLPFALAGILDQSAADIVVVKVPPWPADADTAGDAAADGAADQPKSGAKKTAPRSKAKSAPAANEYLALGLRALVAAESRVHVTPRLLVAPGLLGGKLDRDALITAADALRGIAIIDLPLADSAKATADHGTAERAYFVSPNVRVGPRTEPASARVAGVIARSDAERGFWFSPSNQGVSGITGTETDIAFSMGDANSKANELNAARVTTIIHQDGYRLWGNRLSHAESAGFISVRRTQDIINDSLLRAHLWAVDRNITRTYIHEVTEGVNAFLRHLRTIGAIIDGRCWADPELNTADQIVDGRATFDFDFTPPYPAEHITFRSALVNTYLKELFA